MSKTPDWLEDAALQALFTAVREAGGETRAVGGAVRDQLMDRPVMDIDVATTLLPEVVMTLADSKGWKAIPTGIAHGTVTLVIEGRVIEVTTLRRDVETDGRHATVAFTEDWQVDASRRDFTINAMSMDAAGNLYDYFGGEADCRAQRLRFIGDAATRITEDGLRMLRFFRFLASHGKPPADAEALEAITQHKENIASLSGERIAMEMRKLLSTDAPAFALRLMREVGLDTFIFPRRIEAARMIRLQMLEAQAQYLTSVWARAWLLIYSSSALARPHPEFAQEQIQTSPKGKVSGGASSTNSPAFELFSTDATEATSPLGEVGALSGATGEGVTLVNWLTERWKLARHETAQLKLMASLPTFAADAPRHFHTRILRLHGAPAYLDWLLSQAVLQPGTDIAGYITLAQEFAPPTFPVTAGDLIAQGMKEGRALGARLSLLEAVWEESNYTLGKEALLETATVRE